MTKRYNERPANYEDIDQYNNYWVYEWLETSKIKVHYYLNGYNFLTL